MIDIGKIPTIYLEIILGSLLFVIFGYLIYTSVRDKQIF